MIVRSIIALALIAALFGCEERREESRAKSAPADPDLGRPAVLFLGTSLTAGLGLEPEQAYPALIQGKIDSAGMGYRVINAGVSGETSAGALRRVDWLLREPV